MEAVIRILLIMHIGAGGVALVSGLLAIVLRKRPRLHRPVGRTYFWAMTLIFVSALVLSGVHGNVFLFCVGFFSYYSCLTAYRSLRLKGLHRGQRPKWVDWVIEIFFGFMHVVFLGLGGYLIASLNLTFGIVSSVFGLIGLRGNYVTLKRLHGRIVYRNYWVLAHIGGMTGSYIGALTAFAVNNSERIPLPGLVLWLGPTAFLVPFIVWEIGRHQRLAGRFGSETRLTH